MRVLANSVRTGWQPNPGSQSLFLSCPVPECLLEGTRGGGKTDVLCMDFAQHCGVGFGEAWRGILFRESYPQLADVVAKTKRWFPAIFPGVRLADYTWTWPTGEQLLLRHMKRPDQYWDYHGHEYPWIGWEELCNWSTLECYESMLACNRSSHPSVPRKVRATTNPYGKGKNAVKRYFIDPAPAGCVIAEEREIPQLENGELVRKRVLLKRVRLHSSYIENPKLLEADPMYLANIEKISDLNKRRAWMFGDWNVTSGGMFDDLWVEARHVLKPFSIPGSWRIERAYDWGDSSPFSVGWWAISDGTTATLTDRTTRTFPRGSRFRIGEWYGAKKDDKPNTGLRLTSSKIAEGIVEREKKMGIHERVKPGPADSMIFDVRDGECIADKMAAKPYCVKWLEADKRPGSRKNGWALCRDMLEAVVTGDDKPGLYVFENCRAFIALFPNLPRDEDDPDDVDTESEDHVGDETRYEVLGPKPIKSSSQPLRV